MRPFQTDELIIIDKVAIQGGCFAVIWIDREDTLTVPSKVNAVNLHKTNAKLKEV